MCTTIPHFESLCQRFPTWAEMKGHLESAAGGGLRVIQSESSAPFAVIRSVKGKSSSTAETQFFRSVVWNTETNRPVCVAPPKAKEGLPPVGVQLASTEDFLDGFMMNAFVARSGSGAEPVLYLATRTQIGGSNSFYSTDKSFGDMFREALATTPLKDEAGLKAALMAAGAGAGAGGACEGERGLGGMDIIPLSIMSTAPPVYVDKVNDIRRDMEIIQGGMDTLSRVHGARLRLGFDSAGEAEKDREIEFLTAEITRSFNLAAAKLNTSAKQVDSAADSTEMEVMKNIQSRMAANLHGLSDKFRNMQKTYLMQMKRMGEGQGFSSLLGSGSTTFASFVVSHPQHRVVAKPADASLAVVHMGYVTETGLVQLAEKPTLWPQSLARLQVPSYPLRLFHSQQEIEDLLRKTAVQRGWRWQGLVFKDGAGGRWRLRTPTYSLLRELRGSESTAIERYLRLRSTGKVTDYLKHYREESQDFWDFEKTLRARTADVLAAYSDVHKAHATTFKELPDAYKPAVYQLHVEWLSTLRAKGYKVRLQNAIAVVNKLRAFEQRRLIDAEPYVAKATTPAAAGEAVGNSTETVVAPPVVQTAAQE